jgi:hypothetical protein
MAFLGEEYSVDTLPQGEVANYEPLPAGWYNATIAQAELKQTKTGTGEYIKIRYDITGPTHEGRVVFGNLNLKNASQKAEQIGHQQFRELLLAAGLHRVRDTDELVGSRLSIKLEIRAASEQYAAQNEVRGFKAAPGAPTFSTPAPTVAQVPPASNAQTGRTAPPWASR